VVVGNLLKEEKKISGMTNFNKPNGRRGKPVGAREPGRNASRNGVGARREHCGSTRYALPALLTGEKKGEVSGRSDNMR